MTDYIPLATVILLVVIAATVILIAVNRIYSRFSGRYTASSKIVPSGQPDQVKKEWDDFVKEHPTTEGDK